MANMKILFYGTEQSKTNENTLELFKNSNNEIFIEIMTSDSVCDFICLDKSTAIKLHRELKKQISFIESEVENG